MKTYLKNKMRPEFNENLESGRELASDRKLAKFSENLAYGCEVAGGHELAEYPEKQESGLI